MKLRSLISLAVYLGALNCGQAAAQPAPYKEMSPSDEEALEMQALQGDGKAAFQLANYAGYKPHTKENRDKELYWATISAEDGLPAGSYQLGMILFDDASNPQSAVRAEYWLKRAKSQGISVAEFGLCMLEKRKNPNLPPCELH